MTTSESVTMTTPRPPRRAAMTVWQLLVWAVRDQRCLDDHSPAWDPDSEPHGWSGDGCAWVDRVASVGCEIDGGQHRNVGPDRLHPDAVAVRQALFGLDSATRWLLVDHARIGDRPERSDMTPRPLPWRTQRSREEFWGVAEVDGERIEYREAIHPSTVPAYPVLQRGDWHEDDKGRIVRYRGEARRVPALYCPIRWLPSADHIAHVNAVADAFEVGLERLADQIAIVGLRDHHMVRDDP